MDFITDFRDQYRVSWEDFQQTVARITGIEITLEEWQKGEITREGQVSTLTHVLAAQRLVPDHPVWGEEAQTEWYEMLTEKTILCRALGVWIPKSLGGNVVKTDPTAEIRRTRDTKPGEKEATPMWTLKLRPNIIMNVFKDFVFPTN